MNVETPARQPRTIKQLRAVVSMLANYIWTKQLRPGEHLWSIPVDRERDFDCILSDAISELETLRGDVARLRHLVHQLEGEIRHYETTGCATFLIKQWADRLAALTEHPPFPPNRVIREGDLP